jgi:hypothetical protein
VGVLDADPLLKGRSFHGIPILGTPADIGRLLGSRPDVKEVVLSAAPEPGEQDRLRSEVRAAGARLVLAPSALRFTEI